MLDSRRCLSNAFDCDAFVRGNEVPLPRTHINLVEGDAKYQVAAAISIV